MGHADSSPLAIGAAGMMSLVVVNPSQKMTRPKVDNQLDASEEMEKRCRYLNLYRGLVGLGGVVIPKATCASLQG